MTGYMRRLDGAYGKVKGGKPVMNPFAPNGEAKWDIDPDKTPCSDFGRSGHGITSSQFFFCNIWGPIMQVIDKVFLNALLASAWSRSDDVSLEIRLESCILMCVGNATLNFWF